MTTAVIGKGRGKRAKDEESDNINRSKVLKCLEKIKDGM